VGLNLQWDSTLKKEKSPLDRFSNVCDLGCMKAYKALWADSESRVWSLMAGHDDWFKDSDTYLKRPLEYRKDGTAIVSDHDMKPYLFAYKTLADAKAAVLATYRATVVNGVIVPNPVWLRRDSNGKRVSGHIELWQVEAEPYPMPKVDWSKPNTILPDVFYDAWLTKGYPDTVFCKWIKLIRRISKV
jgi:hypothetical protein